MHRLLFIIVTYSIIFASCQKNKKVEVLETNSAFDLELVDFQENVPMLYSKHLLNSDGIRYDSIRDGKLTDEILKYKISNTIISTLKIDVPQQDLGFLFRSPQLDSVAKFGKAHFHNLSVLTDRNKKPIAFYAETEYGNKNSRKEFMNEFIQKYGKPRYAFCISPSFDQCSYEWILEDRTIQIKTSFGHRFSISSDQKYSNGKYYKLDMLIIENKYKDDIYKAHIYQFGDSIKLNDTYYSYKDLQFEKDQIFEDDFLLNSTFDKYVNDEYGFYHIHNSEDYEEKVVIETDIEEKILETEEAQGAEAVEAIE